MQEMVIQDNNPDMLLFLILVIAAVSIICNLLEMVIKKKRLKNLEDLKKKIQEIHDSIIY